MSPAASKRIVLIHATPVSIRPIDKAFNDLWPEAERVNLLDDSLGPDLRESGKLTDRISSRIADLADYGCAIGAQGILYTCSAFGAAIDEVKRRLNVPVLKPNEAMLEEALGMGRKIGLVSSFGPTIPSMENELFDMAEARAIKVELIPVLEEEAFSAALSGDIDKHNRLLCTAAQALRGCDVVMLAQFSTAAAAEALRTVLDCPVLTSPDTAVTKLKQLILSEPL